MNALPRTCLVTICVLMLLGGARCATDETPPTLPSNLARVTPTKDNAPTFTWDAASDPGSGVAHYLILMDEEDWLDIGNETTYTCVATIPDGTHTLQVKAVDKAGNESLATSLQFLCDTTPPEISGLGSSYVGETMAIVAWTTNEASTSQVEFGATTDYGASSLLDITMVTNHSVVLSGLAAGNTYHYRVKSRDDWGNEASAQGITLVTHDVPWPGYGRDAQRTGRGPCRGPDTAVVKAIAAGIDISIQYCPPLAVSEDGFIYIGGYEKVLAIDPLGHVSTLWSDQYPYVDATVYSLAIAPDGTILVAASCDAAIARYGVLYCLRANGTEVWHRDLGELSNPVYNPLAISEDGTIYVAPHHGLLQAIDRIGGLKWKVEDSSCSYAGVAIGSDGTVYFGVEGSRRMRSGMYAYTREGQQIWYSPVGADAQLSVGDDGTIFTIGYVGDSPRSLCAVNPDGSVKWTKSDPYPGNDLAIGPDGTIYYGYGWGHSWGSETGVVAANPDGTEKWRSPSQNPSSVRVIVDGSGVVYASASYDDGPGGVVALDPADGRSIWFVGFEGYSDALAFCRACSILVHTSAGQIAVIGDRPT